MKQLVNNFLTIKIGKFFNFTGDYKKRVLNDIKVVLENALLILLELDAPAVWTEDKIVAFFEVSGHH